MEVLWKYGSAEQKERWLRPLLAGEIRSVFCMTEPDVASSDATNLQATIVPDGEGDGGRQRQQVVDDEPRPSATRKVAIFMGRTPDASKDRHHQHSMVLVPLDAPGVTDRAHAAGVRRVRRARTATARCASRTCACRAPTSSRGLGMGFEIAQGRLGPGRIHHCMRCIGAAEAALELMVERGTLAHAPSASRCSTSAATASALAEARIAIDQARLLTLYAAWKLDQRRAARRDDGDLGDQGGGAATCCSRWSTTPSRSTAAPACRTTCR